MARRLLLVAAALAVLGLCGVASANVFDLGAGYRNLETVRVGDPGNSSQLSGAGAGGYGPNRYCGSVDYSYNIGTYEVTAKQYCDFLNNKAQTDPYGLYSTYMARTTDAYGCNIQRSGVDGHYTYSVAIDWANRPVNYVSYWDACRFANWLGNGQGNADTENGAYTLGGYTGTDGRSIQRNAGALWAVTSEDEWYKAAYYRGGGTNTGYWTYPTRSDSLPANKVTSPDPGNSANFIPTNGDYYSIAGPYYRTNVGEFERSSSAYGTFDQGGNVREWTEAVVYEDPSHGDRGLRGGSFYDSSGILLGNFRQYVGPSYESDCVGFRVSQTVPEPSSIIALASGLLGLIRLRRRRA
jgi:sulfatase modifying factor 1